MSPFKSARQQASIADLRRPCFEVRGRATPAQCLDIAEERGIRSQRRQILEQQCQSASLAAQDLWREVLDGAVAADEPRGAYLADAVYPWIPVGRVADEGEEVRDAVRVDAEFRAHRVCVSHLVRFAIHLHHPIANDALREILVRRPDADLQYALVRRGEMRGGGERSLPLEPDHRPALHDPVRAAPTQRMR